MTGAEASIEATADIITSILWIGFWGLLGGFLR